MNYLNEEKPFYPRVPFISVELTNHCNLRCPYCGNRNMTRPRGFMSMELLDKIVTECGREGYAIVALHGAGEPLLYPGLESVFTLIKDNRAGLAALSTNGVLLTPERGAKLIEAGLDLIHISLDSLNPEVYSNTRGADLAKIVENIKDFIRIAPSTLPINISLMNSKVQILTDRDTEFFYETFGVHPNVSLEWDENLFFPLADQDYRIVPQKDTWCLLPECFFPIMWDGRVALCCVDQDIRHPLGDMRRNTIKEIWFDKRNQAALGQLTLGEPGCPDYCIEKCTMAVDPSIAAMSETELAYRRSQHLRKIAGNLSKQQRHCGLTSEFFTQRAQEFFPEGQDGGEVRETAPQRQGGDSGANHHFLHPFRLFVSYLTEKWGKHSG